MDCRLLFPFTIFCVTCFECVKLLTGDIITLPEVVNIPGEKKGAENFRQGMTARGAE